MKTRSLCLALLAGVSMTTPAAAFTDCTIALQMIYAGDEGNIWLHYTNGGSAYMTSADPDKTSITALATTALATGRGMIVRYAANGVACNGSARSDLQGVYLN